MTPQNENDELNNARIVEPSTQSQPADPVAPPASVAPPPLAPPSATSPAPVPPKKRRKLLPILIVVGVLALLGGGMAAAYTMWYQNPDRVMAEAMANMLESKQMQQSTVITSDSVIPLGVFTMKFSKVSFESTNDSESNNSMNLGLDVDLNGRPYKLGGQAVTTKNGDLYFKLNDTKGTYAKFLKDIGTGDITLSPRANELMAEIENTWVKADMNSQDDSTGKLGCIAKEFNDSNEDIVLFMKETYADSPFLVVDEKLTPKDGNLGYRVKLDQVKAIEFLNKLGDKDELKGIKKCIGGETADDVRDRLSESEKKEADPTVDIWVSRWSHKLQEVDYTLGNEAVGLSSDQFQLKFNGTTKLNYDEDVTVTVPSDARSMQDWQNSVDELIQELVYGSSTVSTQGTITPNRL